MTSLQSLDAYPLFYLFLFLYMNPSFYLSTDLLFRFFSFSFSWFFLRSFSPSFLFYLSIYEASPFLFLFSSHFAINSTSSFLLFSVFFFLPSSLLHFPPFLLFPHKLSCLSLISSFVPLVSPSLLLAFTHTSGPLLPFLPSLIYFFFPSFLPLSFLTFLLPFSFFFFRPSFSQFYQICLLL